MSRSSLSAESVCGISETAQQFLQDSGVSQRETMRVSLLLEETLLRYADRFGSDCTVEVSYSRVLRRSRIRLLIRSGRFDPFAPQEEDAQLMQSLTADVTQRRTVWRYLGGFNVITLYAEPERRLGNAAKMLLGLLLGIVSGVAVRALCGAEVYGGIVSDYIRPLADGYVGLMSVMAIMMCFFTLPLTIVRFDSAAAFLPVARRMLCSYTFLCTAFIALTMLCAAPSLRFSVLSGDASVTLKSGFDALLGFLPGNPVAPFLNFQFVQVLVIGAMFGFSFQAMGEQSKPVVKAFDVCNLVAVLTNNYLTRPLPIYTALMAFSFADPVDGTVLPMLLRTAPVLLIAAALLLIGFTAAVCLHCRIRPAVLWRKLLPVFLVGLSSANLGAFFSAMCGELMDDCGIPAGYMSVCCNLGANLFKPLYSVFLAFSALLAARLTGAEVTPAWLAVLLILSLLLSQAIPNIPGGAAPIIALLFSQLGFDSGVTNTMVSVNAVAQFIIVPVNIFCMQTLSILLANKEDSIDLSVLRS